MKSSKSKHALLSLVLAFIFTLGIIIPVSASVPEKERMEDAQIVAFSKSGSSSKEIRFSSDDFRITGSDSVKLDSIILTALPDAQAGVLMVGNELLASGDVVALSALDGMRFIPFSASELQTTSFSLTPVFSSGKSGKEIDVNLYLLSQDNYTPIAENMMFNTYKNVAYTGRFSAVDPEGDLISFQLVDKPARGSVSIIEDGNGQFVYSPYENKTGKDSFTYIAIDSYGNRSEEATVKIQIEKPTTKVTYADMNDHPAYNDAIQLAEEEIFIGANMNGNFYFHPDVPMTRAEFLAMAMAAAESNVMSGITVTGFSDDYSIQTWAKPYVASALKTGIVQGYLSDDGRVEFHANQAITHAEAAVLLDRLLSISDASIETWAEGYTLIPEWACQSVMNLETAGLMNADDSGTFRLHEVVTRADAAQLIGSALDLIKERKSEQSWFKW